MSPVFKQKILAFFFTTLNKSNNISILFHKHVTELMQNLDSTNNMMNNN